MMDTLNRLINYLVAEVAPGGLSKSFTFLIEYLSQFSYPRGVLYAATGHTDLFNGYRDFCAEQLK